MTTYARIVASFRFICDSNATAHSNPSIVVGRDTYRAYIQYIQHTKCTLTHYTARSHSYLKRRHSLSRCYVHETIFLLFLFCTCFAFDSIFTSDVAHTYVCCCCCHSMGDARSHATVHKQWWHARTHTTRLVMCVYRCCFACLCVRACVRIMVGY